MHDSINTPLPTVRVGYLPLTDCASLVVALERGFDRKYGVQIVLSRESSWAAVRDKLGSGALDAAHVLYGLVYGVQLGIGCQPIDMAVLMSLSQNGQSITLARSLAARGAVNGATLARRIKVDPRRYTFAQTFPTGNHAMLLNYWLAAHGVDPLRDARMVTVPPTQMVANLRDSQIDGFCVGEPWGQRAVQDDIGITMATSQQIWQDHPGKVLGTTAQYADSNPAVCQALIAALHDASDWIDASDDNKEAAATMLAMPAYLKTDRAVIAPRLLGRYDDGLGVSSRDRHALAFYRGGEVNYPYLSDAMWFMTQHKRWGLLREHPDYLAIARQVNRIDLYEGGAALSGTPLPASPMRSSTLIDGVIWNGSDPVAYADGFVLHH